MRLRAGAFALAAGAVALVVVWWIAPPRSAPIYDGCLTGPYQKLGANPGPGSTSQAFPAGSTFQPAQALTPESPAQAQILMMDGTFVSREPFTVSITPIAPPAPPPSGQQFDSNVYRIVAMTSSGHALQPLQLVTVVLRAESSGSDRAIARLDGGRWTALKTFMAGCGDEYEAESSSLGVFAITVPAGAATPPSSGGFPVVLVVVIALLVLAVAVVALLSVNRPPRRIR